MLAAVCLLFTQDCHILQAINRTCYLAITRAHQVVHVLSEKRGVCCNSQCKNTIRHNVVSLLVRLARTINLSFEQRRHWNIPCCLSCPLRAQFILCYKCFHLFCFFIYLGLAYPSFSLAGGAFKLAGLFSPLLRQCLQWYHALLGSLASVIVEFIFCCWH